MIDPIEIEAPAPRGKAREGWVKINVAISLAMLGSILSGTVTATVGYQALMSRLDRIDAAVFGSPADLSEPGLRADMRSVDRRLNTLSAAEAATESRLAALKDRFEVSAFHGGGGVLKH